MRRRALGNTGITVSPIGLGLVKLGRNTGVKYPEAFELPGDADAMRLLDTAAELGVNLLDTAPAYGTSEQRLGALLAKRGDRDSWLISTKAGETFEDGVSRYDFSPVAIEASCEGSLRRLRTDRVDILLLHSDGGAESRFDELGSFDALDRLKQRGLIVASGASVKTPGGAASAIGRVDVVMLDYSIAAPAMGGMIDLARDRGVGVLVKKALASGRVGAGHGVSAVEALGFVFEKPGVSSVVVGTINPAHLRENVGVCGSFDDGGGSESRQT